MLVYIKAVSSSLEKFVDKEAIVRRRVSRQSNEA